MCMGEEKIEGRGRYLKNKLIIYIYIWVQVSVYYKETKNKNKLPFQREGSIRPREEKKIQVRKIYQFKSVKALVIAW